MTESSLVCFILAFGNHISTAVGWRFHLTTWSCNRRFTLVDLASFPPISIPCSLPEDEGLRYTFELLIRVTNENLSHYLLHVHLPQVTMRELVTLSYSSALSPSTNPYVWPLPGCWISICWTTGANIHYLFSSSPLKAAVVICLPGKLMQCLFLSHIAIEW